MSRVVYLGNFEPPHSTENDVLSALRKLGHDVQPRQEQVWESWTTPVDADVVLWTRTKSLSEQIDIEVRLDFLYACERNGTPTVGYHLDRWWGLKRQSDIEDYRDPFFQVSLLCTADGGHDEQWKRAGVEHAWFPPAVNEDYCYLADAYPHPCDLIFVGSWNGYGHDEWWPQRANMLEHVRSWYGDRFCCLPSPGEPRIVGAALNELYASAKVVVGDSCLAPAADGEPITRYWSDRVPETLGRGGILVHPHIKGLFETPALYTYPLGDMDKLHDLLTVLLRRRDNMVDERDATIAEVRNRHTYTVRMQQLWDRLGL